MQCWSSTMNDFRKSMEEEVAKVKAGNLFNAQRSPLYWQFWRQSGFVLSDRNKPIIFSMARLDRVKNIIGLVELYGWNARLKELVNLVMVVGEHAKESKDLEEQEELKKMYNLIEEYKLNGPIRWISAQMNMVFYGKLYRYIADTKGTFVLPAFYEAFGLTVIEAMTRCLPTFATCNGGPAEIIVHGVSGFQVDSYRGNKAAEVLVSFFDKCTEDPTHWEKRVLGGLQCIYEKTCGRFLEIIRTILSSDESSRIARLIKQHPEGIRLLKGFLLIRAKLKLVRTTK